MINDNIKAIYQKCLSNTATSEERRQFVEWIRNSQNDTAARELLLSALYADMDEEYSDDEVVDAILHSILWVDKQAAPAITADLKSAVSTLSPSLPSSDFVPPVHRVPFLQTAWFRYAAILLLIAGTATYLWLAPPSRHPAPAGSLATTNADLPPGTTKATLVLSDGTTIALDSAANGSLAQQGNTKILKLDAGSLAYRPGNTAGEVMYNTISTPRGGQYQITLPDGTKVWLNAASSIRFPTVFEKDRTVEVTGESYLEVAADKRTPFFVKAGEITIQVLGTSFNINAYRDEEGVKTTLIDGSVKVVNGGNSHLLQPGQAYREGKVFVTNVEQDIAWKNGYFNFHKMPLTTALRQIERWYNVTVEYQGKPPVLLIYGEIGRDLSLSQVLEILSDLKVHYRVEGKKILILP